MSANLKILFISLFWLRGPSPTEASPKVPTEGQGFLPTDAGGLLREGELFLHEFVDGEGESRSRRELEPRHSRSLVERLDPFRFGDEHHRRERVARARELPAHGAPPHHLEREARGGGEAGGGGAEEERERGRHNLRARVAAVRGAERVVAREVGRGVRHHPEDARAEPGVEDAEPFDADERGHGAEAAARHREPGPHRLEREAHRRRRDPREPARDGADGRRRRSRWRRRRCRRPERSLLREKKPRERLLVQLVRRELDRFRRDATRNIHEVSAEEGSDAAAPPCAPTNLRERRASARHKLQTDALHRSRRRLGHRPSQAPSRQVPHRCPQPSRLGRRGIQHILPAQLSLTAAQQSPSRSLRTVRPRVIHRPNLASAARERGWRCAILARPCVAAALAPTASDLFHSAKCGAPSRTASLTSLSGCGGGDHQHSLCLYSSPS
mmetsp:Transcript_7439/g.24704  ORF Transcript_7439/g.24704 Transcript_7439/m.24704 type:complete len:442 (+) Transcript_7439:246-1571(+)